MTESKHPTQLLDVLIVGAGQAGVSLSYFLDQTQTEYVVLEKDQPFSAWYGRWDAFGMNTPNWMNTLPGARHQFSPGGKGTEFGSKSDALRYFEDYLEMVSPPVIKNTPVTGVLVPLR